MRETTNGCQVQLDSHRWWVRESIRLGCPKAADVYARAAERLRRYMVRNGATVRGEPILWEKTK